MNPYIIIAALLAACGLWFGGEHHGHTAGVNEQAAADQKQFDKINKDLADQKAEAHRIYEADQANIIALQQTRDTIAHQLEADHAKAQTDTNTLRDKLAAVQLWFPAAKDSGHGPSGGLSKAGEPNTASDPTASACVLSAAASQDLKSIVFGADTLRDDYQLLYDWAHSDAVKCSR